MRACGLAHRRGGHKPTEQVVLWRMQDQGPRLRQYDAEALRFYREKLGRPVRVASAIFAGLRRMAKVLAESAP